MKTEVAKAGDSLEVAEAGYSQLEMEAAEAVAGFSPEEIEDVAGGSLFVEKVAEIAEVVAGASSVVVKAAGSTVKTEMVSVGSPGVVEAAESSSSLEEVRQLRP